MYLRSLTMKGFKSFASATTMHLEPGITCVVGPNGSGKSNVVDALAWVMGEQGAKTLRGGKMEDVIFAGTAGRGALGRAEVSLTIDNSDGKLPIDFEEVTITRTMFRTGGSEYHVNGTQARLLDIQELLSDSGIGREMHVIVGQNQLDQVLRATPEDRRGFIEEAAGVLKHRRRKERALRKISAMEANLTRLTDLTTEVRRQLGPLGRQAETARQASVIHAQVRDATSRLLADDIAQVEAALAQDQADSDALQQRRAQLEQHIAELKAQVTAAETRLGEVTPQVDDATAAWHDLTQTLQNLRGLHNVCRERITLLTREATQPSTGRDLDQMRQQLQRLQEQVVDLESHISQATDNVDHAGKVRAQAEEALAQEERKVAADLRAAAERREHLATCAGRVGVTRSQTDAAEAEVTRLTQALKQAEQRHRTASKEWEQASADAHGVQRDESGLDQAYAAAAAELSHVQDEVARCRQELNTAQQDVAKFTATVETLKLSLARRDGGGDLLTSAERPAGVKGDLAGALKVAPGYEPHVAAALAAAADAIVVDSVDAGVDALRWLRDHNAGQATLIVADADRAEREQQAARGANEAAPDGLTWVATHILGEDATANTVRQMLNGYVCAPDLTTAHRVALNHPTVVAVSPEGDLVSRVQLRGGSADRPSALQVQATIDQTSRDLAQAQEIVDQATATLEKLRTQRDDAKTRTDQALKDLHEADARRAAVSERLAHLNATMTRAQSEVEPLNQALIVALRKHEQAASAWHQAQETLAAAEAEPAPAEPDMHNRMSLSQQATDARQGETEAKVALRAWQEQHTGLRTRVESLQRGIESETRAQEQRARQVAARERSLAKARAVDSALTWLIDVAQVEVQSATDRKHQVEREREEHAHSLIGLRQNVDKCTVEFNDLTTSVHRDEVQRTEQRLHLESLVTRCVEELGMDAKVLVEEFGPHQPVPVASDTDGEEQTAPYVRADQEKRLRQAQRAMKQLGKVNPLALEEFTALEERHRFLNEQVDDLTKARRDLLDLVRDVDARVEEVFTAAWQDTRDAFEQVFPRLFPGGEGRLVLTDPSNMLTTGIDVEARPAGKKVKRLSLLSGGERSLTAVALLVAIFKARPSPFYVLDEVEAALDDTNLGRLISVLEELRESSQLIIITHQKRTMETADALYGVAMRGDGVSTVVSEKLRTRKMEPAPCVKV